MRVEIEAEFASGYALLRRIPSDYTWKHLCVVDLLSPEARSKLFDISAEHACYFLETETGPEERNRRRLKSSKNPVFIRHCNDVAAQVPWKYADPKYMRMCVDSWYEFHGKQSLPASANGLDFSPLLAPAIAVEEPPKKCNASVVRSAIKKAFASRFKTKPLNTGGGCWKYPGQYKDRLFTLSLEWNRHGGPNYGIVIGRHALDFVPTISWERLLGFGIGRWDFVCEHNLDESIELMANIIEKTLALLPDTLPWHPELRS